MGKLPSGGIARKRLCIMLRVRKENFSGIFSCMPLKESSGRVVAIRLLGPLPKIVYGITFAVVFITLFASCARSIPSDKLQVSPLAFM